MAGDHHCWYIIVGTNELIYLEENPEGKGVRECS